MSGWRMLYRRRVRILPCLWVNVSRGGLSWTIGRRGAAVTIGRRGVSQSVRIAPGVYVRRRVRAPH